MRDITLTRNRKRAIWYFVFVAFIIPTIQVSGLTIVVGRFTPNPLGYNLLAFILSAPLWKNFNKNYGNLRGIVMSILVLTIYIIVTFMVTAYDTSFMAALTVFRHSYMQVLNLLILLPFMFSLKKEEVNYALHCMFKCLIVFTFIYLSNNLIYDWLGVKGGLVENVNGATMDRSIIGMPLYDPVWTALLMTYVLHKVPKANKYMILILLAIIISFTRSALFSTLIVISVVALMSILKNLHNISRTFKFLAIIIVCILFIAIFMPNVLEFWIAKLLNTFNNDLKYDVGTLAFREELIDKALYVIRDNPLFGLGYVRDVAKGEYSIVMGGDTYIAPILWCEGWLGILLRTLPYLILGLNSLSSILIKKSGYYLNLIIISSIIAAAINYVQTNMITNYPLTLGIIILLKIKDNYDRKTQNFGNYSIL